MTIADRPTDTARTTMNVSPIVRRCTPRADASSALTELSNSGRPIAASVNNTTALSTAASGSVDDCTVKIEPKRIDCVVPVAELCVVER